MGTSETVPACCHVLLFGDLTADFEDDLRELLHCKADATLQAFFERVSLALKERFASLPSEQQDWLPRITTPLDLLASFDSSVGAPAMRSALLCVYEIARVLHTQQLPETESSVLVGICTGAFAAAAVSTTQTLPDLVSTGVLSTLAAFEAGLHSLFVQRDIAVGTRDDPDSWSFIVSLTEPKAIKVLGRYKSEANLSHISQPYISAVTPSTVTISGPPLVLATLIDSFALKAHRISIRTPYHGRHLTALEDIDRLLEFVKGDPLRQRRQRVPLLSMSGDICLEGYSLGGLLQRAMIDTLREQVRWDRVCPRLASLLKTQGRYESLVVSPVASNAANLLAGSLQQGTQLNVTISDKLSSKISKADGGTAPGSFANSKIAIIGYSGRYPEAASNEELWEVLKAARDCHRTIPSDRFDWQAHHDPEGKRKNHTRVKYGCFVNDPGLFDSRFFNLSPRESENTDPAQRLALLSTYEAIEMAGLVPGRTPSTQRDRIGVFFGVTSDDWREVNSGQDIDTYFSGNRAFVPGRISYFFRFSGPSISVDTACSSSFAAISTACSYLRQGSCDTVIAGGANILTNPDNFVGLDRGHFLSTTGNCDPFDDRASGYCRADAVGSVILKRLEDAIADNDPIHGVIVGADTNHCGQTVSITRPNEHDQLALFHKIMTQTNTKPTDVSYVEMHGTGTQAGDAAEMQSVLAALVPGYDRQPSHPLHLGAIKANVGHSEAASGVTALIKVLMMLKNGEIPRHRLDGPLNRHYPVDLADRNVHIALDGSHPWHRQDYGGHRMALLNNFSAAGGNTAILLEDAPQVASMLEEGKREASGAATSARYGPSAWPVTVSAKTLKAFAANAFTLATHLDATPNVSLAALSYTTTARRAHYRYRAVISGHDVSTTKDGLRAAGTSAVSPTPAGSRKLAFAFSGQGTLYFGIGHELFESVATFRDDLCRFDRIVCQQGFPSFLSYVKDDASFDISDADPVASQLAITGVQMALYRLWVQWTGPPVAIVGHSLGEYAALNATGVLSASDALWLVGRRAQLLVAHCDKSTHSMLAIQSSLADTPEYLAQSGCTVACVNSPTSTVVSGSVPAIQSLAGSLKAQGVSATPLNVPYAFHSTQIDSILDEFEAVASVVEYNTPKIPYLSPCTVNVESTASNLNARYLRRAAREVVDFTGALEAGRTARLVDDSTTWIDIGAHPACLSMIAQTAGCGAIGVPSLRKGSSDWKVIMGSVETLYRAGCDVQWNDFHRGLNNVQPVLPLPSYKWDLKHYWIDYRHNFCLTKGDDPATFAPQGPTGTDTRNDAHRSMQYVSSSVHRIVEETSAVDRSTLVAESDVHDPRLFPILTGHKVNSAMLCPSSLWADMSLTVVKYMLRSIGESEERIGLDCGKMSVQRPFVASPDGTSQLVRTAATAEWPSGTVKVRFYSVDHGGRKLADHASCIVKVSKKQDWLGEWKRSAFLVSSRINMLHKAVDDGGAHKLKRGLVYKLFSSLVDYSEEYQGMEQVILDSTSLEATATVKFQVGQDGFDWNPCWIDSLGHIAGFIMNGNDNVYAKDQVFINHGWDAMRVAKPVFSNKTYTVYNRMQLESGTTYVGDTYIYDEEELVGLFEGVRFQGVPRSTLDNLLPHPKRAIKATAGTTIRQKDTLPMNPTVESDRSATPKVAKGGSSVENPSSDTISHDIIKIIAEEAQIEESELDLNAEFNDLGIDSLLSLTIGGRLSEKFDAEVPSSAFAEYTVVRDFVSHVAQSAAGVSSSSIATTNGSCTPSSSSDGRSAQSDITATTSVSSDEDIMSAIRQVIADETGAAVEDIQPTIALGDLGVDSLLGLNIMSTLSSRVGIDLPPSLMADNETLEDIRIALIEAKLIGKPQEPDMDSATDLGSAPSDALYPSSASSRPMDVAATSVILQGSARTARHILFLFPDGAGSAASYLSLPDISSDLVVYGLNCPYLRNPDALKGSLERYVATFLVEVRRRQPHGPYNFGGWSAGGILAYEAAQQVTQTTEDVASLTLLDSPDPVGLENPNERMYDFLEKTDAFGLGGRPAPKWLRPHFDSFLAMLEAYKVKPFLGSSSPSTHIIYARDGLCKDVKFHHLEPQADDPREMRWLLNERTDFSGAGWNKLLGKKALHVNVLDGVNHYTIVRDSAKVSEVARLMRQRFEILAN
ncbi:hypothetical protein LTR86_009857 [Recurvomyces mirabilis]|nr:hypothetical protein LTR86_009857 [Recurvomyces mirabilis]